MKKNSPIRHIFALDNGKLSKKIVLEEKVYSIGRHSSNSIVLSDNKVSRNHATLLKVKYDEDEVFWIIDGDLKGNRSTNGLFINGKRCLSHELKSGDLIIFGGGIAKAKYEIIYSSSSSLIKYLKQQQKSKEEEQENLLDELDKSTVVLANEELDELTEEFFYRLKYTQDLLPHPIIEINLAGEITYINSVAKNKFKDLETKQLDHPILADLLIEFKARQGKLFCREVQIGREVFTQYVHYLSKNQLIRCYIFDFSKRKKIEAELREREERYRAVVSQISEGIFLADVTTQKLLEANAAYCDLLGYSIEKILDLQIKDVIALDREIVDSMIERIVTKKLACVVESIHRKKDNTLVTVEMSVSLIFYEGKKVLCFAVRDITERKRVEEMLRYQTNHDQLTGLGNRKLFNEQLITALTNARRKQKKLAVMFLDLDRFKTINDTLGHGVGDRLLQNFGQRLSDFLVSGEIIARWGGDEFTILLPQIEDKNTAAKISQKILDTMKEPFKIGQYQLHLKTSIGIAIYPTNGEDEDTLLKLADVALYNAKRRGGDNYQFYSPTMTVKNEEMFKLENQLHYALEREELFLVYQPQVNVLTGEITAMEALLRWQHPQYGLISPEKFIPLAEETGLILPIGEWVLQTACNQNKIWQNNGLPFLRIAVNLSPRQFQQTHLVSMVKRALDESGLSPNYLELEITETILMENQEIACKTLEELRKMGIQIAMDDFGTGYSSLGYLKQFPFQKLKIDRDFVRYLKDEPKDTAIIAAVVALGNGFNLKVVAEGVETVEQLQILMRFRCEHMQGYLFSKPLGAKDATSFLQHQNQMLSKFLIKGFQHGTLLDA